MRSPRQGGRLRTRTTKAGASYCQETFNDFDARGVGLRMSDNLSREELHDRDRARADAEIERRQGRSV